MLFPALNAHTLQGEAKTIPAQLPAQRTLLVLAFEQRHQSDVDEWMAVADTHGWLTDLSQPRDGLPPTAAIEVPCISRRWAPVRRFIDGGMASTIAVPTVLARTWTSYTDVGRVQRALGIADSSQIWVGVLESGGLVTAHVAGRPDPIKITIVSEKMSPAEP